MKRTALLCGQGCSRKAITPHGLAAVVMVAVVVMVLRVC